MTNKNSQGRKMGGVSRLFQLLVLLCISGFILIQHATTVASALRSNFAWGSLNAQMDDETVVTKNLANELDSFTQAIEVNAGNRSAWFGLGLSHALQGEVDSAIDIWSKSETDPTTLIEYGVSARNKGKLDAALIFLRAADALDKSDTKKGYFLAGTICQQTFSMQHLLNELNSQYCSDYLANNGNNLIVNGDFSTHGVFGWQGEFFFSGKNPARLQIEDFVESEGSVVSLMGQDESDHYGLYQRLTLNPGTELRFSGRFKLSGEENLTARLLYISWQKEDGTPHGNHGEQRSGQMKWTEFERIFRVPEDVRPTIDFYPVNFSGEGTIWFDDIQLELVPN